MWNIEKKISELRAELSLWSSLLAPHLNQLNRLKQDDFASYLLGDGSVEDEVSAEFALESLVTTYGRLQEVLLAASNFWPYQEHGFSTQLPYETEMLIAFLKTKVKEDEGVGLGARLIQKGMEDIAEVLSQTEDVELWDCFTLVHRWRRSLAKRSVVEGFESKEATLIEMIGSRGVKVQQLITLLPRANQQIFRKGLRRYMANEYLFPWLSEYYHPFTGGYRDLFALSQLEENVMFGFNERDWDELFGDGEIGHNTRGVVIGIMGRIAEALREIGNYDELVRQITYSNGQFGPNSMIGSPGQVNLIPSDETGECREILIAFAQGRRSSKTGLWAVMRKVREHLIRCGDSDCRNGSQTRVAIIFTDLWDQSIFEESAGDLLAHQQTFPGKVIIGALVNKDKVTPQAIV